MGDGEGAAGGDVRGLGGRGGADRITGLQDLRINRIFGEWEMGEGRREKGDGDCKRGGLG